MRRVTGVVAGVAVSALWAAAVIGLIAAACGPPAGFMGAADAAREAEEARAVTPLPPGATWPPLSFDPNGAYQPGSGRGSVHAQAMCRWFRYWAEAIAKDDATAAAQASTVWDRWRAAFEEHGDQSYRDALESIVERARLGDATGLIEFTKNNCL